MWTPRLKRWQFPLVSVARWICPIWRNFWGLQANMILSRQNCKASSSKTRWLRMTLFPAGRLPMSIFPARYGVSSELPKWQHKMTLPLKSMCRLCRKHSRKIWTLLKLMYALGQPGFLLGISSSSCRKRLKLRFISGKILK